MDEERIASGAGTTEIPPIIGPVPPTRNIIPWEKLPVIRA